MVCIISSGVVRVEMCSSDAPDSWLTVDVEVLPLVGAEVASVVGADVVSLDGGGSVGRGNTSYHHMK